MENPQGIVFWVFLLGVVGRQNLHTTPNRRFYRKFFAICQIYHIVGHTKMIMMTALARSILKRRRIWKVRSTEMRGSQRSNLEKFKNCL